MLISQLIPTQQELIKLSIYNHLRQVLADHETRSVFHEIFNSLKQQLIVGRIIFRCLPFPAPLRCVFVSAPSFSLYRASSLS